MGRRDSGRELGLLHSRHRPLSFKFAHIAHGLLYLPHRLEGIDLPSHVAGDHLLVRACEGKAVSAAFVASPGLLENMGKFVRQKPVARERTRSMLAWGEDNVVADSVGPGMDGFGGLCSFRVVVDPYRTKIARESRLKKGAAAGIKGPPAGRDRLADVCRRNLRARVDIFPPQYRLVLRLAGRATAQNGLVAKIAVLTRRKAGARNGARRA